MNHALVACSHCIFLFIAMNMINGSQNVENNTFKRMNRSNKLLPRVEWIDVPQNQTVVEKRNINVSFRCAVRSNHLPTSFSWLMNSMEIEEGKKYTIENGVNYTELKLHDPEVVDSGFYRCDILIDNQLYSSTGILRVVPSDTGVGFDNSESEDLQQDLSHKVYFMDDSNTKSFCELYRGDTCKHLIGRRMIYVTSSTQQDSTEKLLNTGGLSQLYGKSITDECRKTVLFITCLYAFPLCDEDSYPLRAKQLCRSDCDYFEKVACRSLFTDSKNPFKQLKLPSCNELPPSSDHPDCVSLSYLMNDLPRSDHTCYNESGKSYRGMFSTTKSGRSCLPWTFVTSLKDYKSLSYVNHPELGNHQYCRNPLGYSEIGEPWCFVNDLNNVGELNSITQEACNVPKCVSALKADLWMIVVPSILIPAFLALGLIFTYLICCKRQSNKNSRKQRLMRKQTLNSTTLVNSPLLSAAGGGCKSAAGTSSDSRHSTCKEVVASQIRFLKEIGEGRFGPAYIGEVRRGNSREILTPCYIKTLKDSSRLDQFLAESFALTSPLFHTHISCLIGLCHDPPAALFEYLRHDLHEILLSERRLELIYPLLPQVIAAMSYLSSRHVVHRDLAARNVLVDEYKKNAKVSDIGSCKSMYAGDYYRLSGSILPVRWMAPEAVLTGSYSSHSDVWSFGVLLWEFFTNGKRPYDGCTNPEVIEKLRDRQLLIPPDNCYPSIKSLMLDCWAEIPVHRPTFPEILVRMNTADAIPNHVRQSYSKPSPPLSAMQFKV